MSQLCAAGKSISKFQLYNYIGTVTIVLNFNAGGCGRYNILKSRLSYIELQGQLIILKKMKIHVYFDTSQQYIFVIIIETK